MNTASMGAYDWGCAYAAAYPVFLDDEIRLYYGASNGTHHGWRDGFLALATLRPDGFAGYVPVYAGKPATVLTQPVRCSGRTLRITADARGGSARVTVLGAEGKPIAASKPVARDVTDATVTLEGGADLAQIRGQPVRLKFELTRAKLYAFAFSN